MELMPGYKHSDVGVIPEDWSVRSLGEIATIKDGTHQTPKYQASGVPFYSVEHVTSGDFENTKFISEQEHQFLTRSFRIEKGDILMTRIGSIGECKLIDWDVRASFYVSLALLKIKGASAEYIAQYSNSSTFKREIELHSLQHATPKKINLGPISYIKIALPQTEAEQSSIARALSDVDALLATLDQVIAKKRDLKRAAMQQLLTGETRLPGFHGEWELSQVQDVIATYFCGPSPTCEERNIQDDEEWGVLKTTAATKENGWDWTKHKTLPRLFWNKPQIELKNGDVIVTKAGPRHRVGVTAWIDYVPPRIIPSGKMITLRPNPKKVLPLMLAAAVAARDAQTYLDQRTTGMAESQVNFENNALLEAPIEIPCIEEQTAIATVISDMDAELSVLEARRNKTHNIKQAMMQELLTGKTRLIAKEDTHV